MAGAGGTNTKDSLKALFGTLREKYGADVIKLGSEVSPVEFVSTGLPALDEICGGGLPRGRVVEVWGPKAAGKTSLVLRMIAAVQQSDAKAKVAYFDLENTFSNDWARQLGVDTDRLLRIGAMYAEDIGDIVVKMVRQRWALVAVDSVVGLLPGKELERSLDVATPGVLAMMLSRILPKVVILQGQSPTILVLVNQVRDKIGFMFGDGTKSPGGHAMEHFDSLKIRVQRKKAIEKKGEHVGFEVAFKVLKSKVGIEGQSTTARFIWGRGFE